MKYHTLLLLLILLLLNCPKKYAPKVEKIEVLYLSSLYEDIHREKPFLAGIKNLSGIKIGHLKTDPPCMERILRKLGFYQLLDEFPIDYVISDTLIYSAQYMSIPESMGYGIKNYEGIRFALLCKNKDTLTIEDEIKLTIVKQRSDVLWIIDKDLINSAPMKISFFIEDRGLSDTSITAIKVNSDTTLLRKLQDFKNTLEQILNKKVYLGTMYPGDYILSQTALSEGVNVILYPEGLFGEKHMVETYTDSITLREILTILKRCKKFKKLLRMSENEILKLSGEKDYQIWGNLAKINQVLIPDEKGKSLFDLCPLFKGLLDD